MAKVRIADFIFSYLEKIGVRDIFTVVGGGSIFLNDALAINKNLRYYCCHHEQAVAMATEAYARVKGDIGVSLVTTGPGGTNAITGVAGSWIDSVPHLIISGQVFFHQTIRNTGVRQLGVQELNIIDLVKPITKFAVMIEDAKKTKYYLQKAIYLAKTGRPGPVWLDIPGDIQNAKIEESELIEFNPSEMKQEPFPNDLGEKVRQVVLKLKAAKRPLLHAGQGIKIAKADREFIELVNRYCLPFVTARNANDLIPTDHPFYVGRPGTFSQRPANFAVQNADLYLAIGTRLSLPQTGYNSKDYARNAYRIMVDIDPSELNKDTLDFHLKIQSDAKIFLEELCRQLNGMTLHTKEWLECCQNWKKKYPVVLPEYESQKKFVNTYWFIHLLSDLASSKDVIVTDMGIAFQGTHQAFRVKAGQRLFTNSGLAPMGWGLPAAVGACVAHHKQRTICIAGEGGLQMNIQELATVMHHRLPIKLFVYNNGGYLTIKQTQEYGFGGRLMGCNKKSGISFPDLEKIAEAHKIKFFRLTSHKKLKENLQKVLKTPGPVLCELMVNPDQLQIPKFLARKRADGTTEYTPLEDLYPYLDRKEFEQNMAISQNENKKLKSFSLPQKEPWESSVIE